MDDSKDVLEETTVDKATDNIIDMSEAELIPMVAEKKEYQYNADAFEARGMRLLQRRIVVKRL